MKLCVVFGSTSDEKKILPGIQKATEEIPDLDVELIYASADNTPHKVQETFEKIRKQFRVEHPTIKDSPGVFISGAGMSNVLTGVSRQYANIEDLVIGVPITDSSTNGLSSFLSTVEKPPRNPVLAVGLNDIYSALNIAYRFLKDPDQERQIVVYDPAGPLLDDLDEQIGKLKEKLKDFNLPFSDLKAIIDEDLNPHDIILTVASIHRLFYARGLDEKLGKERMEGAIQVVVPVYPKPNEIYGFTQGLGDTDYTGFVGSGSAGYTNAAIVAAQLTRNKEALATIAKQKQDKTVSLGAHKGYVLRGGEIVKF